MLSSDSAVEASSARSEGPAGGTGSAGADGIDDIDGIDDTDGTDLVWALRDPQSASDTATGGSRYTAAEPLRRQLHALATAVTQA